MVFNTLDFIIFFPIVFLVYLIVPTRFRKYTLLIASYYFYICWNVRYIILIVIVTVVTWLAAYSIDKIRITSKSIAIEKAILGIGITIVIAMLGIFKYLNFIIDSINSVFNHINIDVDLNRIDIVLPVGISFYTFQALAYLIDVYRGDIKAERNVFSYALFVSFFPQLVAGPIERSGHLLKQFDEIEKIRIIDWSRIIDGLKTMLYGFFLKMVVADRAAIYVNEVFGNYHRYNSSIIVIATILFSFQIYCDFNSYSLIAIGCAKVMGFEIVSNFDAPYFAKSVSDFWRRWHISLNTWFRDYLYIPLGGNRCSRGRRYFNTLIVFLVSGLWHGANWTYIIWGGLNGLLQVIESILKTPIKKFNRLLGTKVNSFSYHLLQNAFAFLLINFTWIFFRADSIKDALGLIRRIFTRWDPWAFSNADIVENLLPKSLSKIEFIILLTGLLAVITVDLIKYTYNLNLNEFLSNQCIWFRWMVYIGVFFSILIYGVYGPNYQSVDYIYFQF